MRRLTPTFHKPPTQTQQYKTINKHNSPISPINGNLQMQTFQTQCQHKLNCRFSLHDLCMISWIFVCKLQRKSIRHWVCSPFLANYSSQQFTRTLLVYFEPTSGLRRQVMCSYYSSNPKCRGEPYVMQTQKKGPGGETVFLYPGQLLGDQRRQPYAESPTL